MMNYCTMYCLDSIIVCLHIRAFSSTISVGIRLITLSNLPPHNNIIRVSDIQGSIYRISSQACAGESSRSGTANVLRNALIWKFHHWSEIIDVMVVVGIDASDCRMSALYAQLPVYTYSDICTTCGQQRVGSSARECRYPADTTACA